MSRIGSDPAHGKSWLVVLAATLGLLVVGGLGVVVKTRLPDTAPPILQEPTATLSMATAPRKDRASELVALLEVKGRAPRTGYERSQFGQVWADIDRNGCDTRNDMLRRDLVDAVIKEGTQGCRVEAGILLDRYSGERVPFMRGDGNVEVDHVVALSDAWQKGAQQWTVEQRTAFANDPVNLVVTTRALNQQKGAGDAASWLPPNRAYRCGYIARQAAVKHRYRIWVTRAERTAMLGILEGCPDEPAPAGHERPTATRQ